MAVRYLNATGTQALINEIKSRLARKADLTSLQALQSALDTVAASIPTNVSQLTNDANYLTETAAADEYATKASVSELSTVVTQNQDSINLLNANDQTPGSVDYKIAQASSAAGIPFYDTALPASIPGWLAQLSENANAANMYIHPTANYGGFEANHTYYAWLMKATIGGSVSWTGIVLGLWTEDSEQKRSLYELDADTNNFIALTQALTSDADIPELTLTDSLAPLFELPAKVKMVRVICDPDNGVPAVLQYNASSPRYMDVKLRLTGTALRLNLSDMELWQLNSFELATTNDSSMGTIVGLYVLKESDRYVLHAETGLILPTGYTQVISSQEIRSLFE